MSKILLIHGSSIGVTYSFLRGDRSIDGGFCAFQKSILLKDISLFSWYLKKTAFHFFAVYKSVDIGQTVPPRTRANTEFG